MASRSVKRKTLLLAGPLGTLPVIALAWPAPTLEVEY